ncbi:MAG TPA: MSHA biogenesis protein MshG [Coxiellaceae bacterium]|nr:MSHA biogenesis protein MshG [Coxiellaceae bacterium]HBS51690.1 MSHA biogenesis protein MshG [Coxiellaceae bacterium]
MPSVFKYKGRDSTGNIIVGDLKANAIEDVITHLKKHDITPINIEPAKKYSAGLKKLFSSGDDFFDIEPYHIMNFYRQLATLNNAGLPIIKSLNKLSQSSSSRRLSIILYTVANDVAAGMTLSNAFKKHPNAFSPLAINIVDIGENTGRLSESLIYLGSYVEASIANKRRLSSATRYPMFVLIAVSAAVVIMNIFVIPKFSEMFAKFHLDLPLSTRIIMGSSNFMVNYKYFILLAAIFIFFGIKQVLKIPSVHYFWDKYKLYIPVFGDLQKRIVLSQFTWTFSLIIRSGIPIIKGIGLASNSTENVYFGEQLLKLRDAIEHGENLSQAAVASGLFTPITIQMIEVGEESEKLDETLSEVAKYYDAEIDYDLKRLNELIEPILLAVVGGLILILALGIYFPLWDLIKVAKI